MYAVEMKNITKTFAEVKANAEVDLQIKKKSIHALLGENGAGKTTLMNILYGLYKQDQGEILIDGEKVKIDSPTDAIDLGIGMVHQHFMLVRTMTVAENILLGLPAKNKVFLDKERVIEKIKFLSEKYSLAVDPHAKIHQLSVGEQQRVEILTAIFGGANILILDEPTAVLTPQEARELFEILAQMKKDGKSIILITHKLEEILFISDEVTVLRNGEKTGHAVIDDSVTKKSLTRMMVGRDVIFDFKKTGQIKDKLGISLEHVHAKNDKGLPALSNVSFDVHEGEILGIAGVDGNGQKELCEVIAGLRPIEEGQIEIQGTSIKGKSPRDIIDQGLAYIPEDRHNTGLAMNLTLEKNFIIKKYGHKDFVKGLTIDQAATCDNAELLLGKYQIKANSIQDCARDLSGGNQQKVILAREISSNPKAIVASQPTRGLDVGAMEYVREQLIEQKNKGVAVLLVSADLEEIQQLSDRVAVIYSGRIMGIVEAPFNIEELGLMMAGVDKRSVDEHVS